MTLIQLFTAIANAIRAKKGTQASIPAENFPQEIAGITTGKLTNEEYEEADEDVDDILENTTVPSGTISITANGEYDVTNYTDANVNVVSEYNAKVRIIPTGRNGNDMLTYNILELPGFDFSNYNNINSFFSGLMDLKKIGNIINTNNITNMNALFNNCQSLIEIPIMDVSNVTNMSMFCFRCYSLNNIGLNNILYMCANVSPNYSKTKTLADLGLDSTQATICTGLSNWASAQQAGWTTGF